MEERLELLGESLEAFRAEVLSGSTESRSEQEAKKRFKAINRNQLMMRPVDVERLVEEDHPVRAIWAMVSQLDWSRFEEGVKVVEGGKGRSGHEPRLKAALWIYAYSQGINSARELSRMCQYEPGCQWLTGMEEVNHHTLSDFRTTDKEAQDELFKQVLGVLSAEGLTDLKRVMQDGTKIRAQGFRQQFSTRRYAAGTSETGPGTGRSDGQSGYGGAQPAGDEGEAASDAGKKATAGTGIRGVEETRARSTGIGKSAASQPDGIRKLES